MSHHVWKLWKPRLQIKPLVRLIGQLPRHRLAAQTISYEGCYWLLLLPMFKPFTSLTIRYIFHKYLFFNLIIKAITMLAPYEMRHYKSLKNLQKQGSKDSFSSVSDISGSLRICVNWPDDREIAMMKATTDGNRGTVSFMMTLLSQICLCFHCISFLGNIPVSIFWYSDKFIFLHRFSIFVPCDLG